MAPNQQTSACACACVRVCVLLIDTSPARRVLSLPLFTSPIHPPSLPTPILPGVAYLVICISAFCRLRSFCVFIYLYFTLRLSFCGFFRVGIARITVRLFFWRGEGGLAGRTVARANNNIFLLDSLSFVHSLVFFFFSFLFGFTSFILRFSSNVT